MPTLAKRHDLEGVHEVAAAPSATIAAGGIMVPPGEYICGPYGKFALTHGGLHVLCNLSLNAGNFIFVGAADPLVLVCAFGCMHDYGAYNEQYSASYNLQQLTLNRLALKCGGAVDVLRLLLGHVNANPGSTTGHPTRKCQVYSTEDPPTPGDFGHVTMEIKIDDKWVLADALTHRVWRDQWGELLSLGEVVVSHGSSFEQVLSPHRTAFWAANAVDLAAGMTLDLPTWVPRLFRIPGILHTDGKMYFGFPPGTEHRQSWVLSLQTNIPYVAMPWNDWLTMFYPA